MEALKALITLVITVIMVGIFCMAFFTVTDTLKTTTHIVDNQTHVDGVLDNMIWAATSFAALLVIGAFVVLILKKRRPRDPLAQYREPPLRFYERWER